MSPAYAARHRHRPPDARRSPAAGARLHYTLTRLWTRTASVRGKTRATRPACQRPQALHADPSPGALALHAWLMYANPGFARSPIRIPRNCDQNAISRSTQRRISILKVCSDVSKYISMYRVVDISNFDIRDRDAAGPTRIRLGAAGFRRCWFQRTCPAFRHIIPPILGGFPLEKAANCSAICSAYWTDLRCACRSGSPSLWRARAPCWAPRLLQQGGQRPRDRGALGQRLCPPPFVPTR
jgi:hypothetical protein